MSEKRSREDWSILYRQCNEEALWQVVQSHTEAIRDEVRKEVTEEILRGRYEIGDKVDVTDGDGNWYPGEVMAVSHAIGKWTKPSHVRRPPKTRPMTREEKIEAFKSRGIFPNLWNSWELFKDQTIDDLCAAAGIKTEVTE